MVPVVEMSKADTGQTQQSQCHQALVTLGPRDFGTDGSQDLLKRQTTEAAARVACTGRSLLLILEKPSWGSEESQGAAEVKARFEYVACRHDAALSRKERAGGGGVVAAKAVTELSETSLDWHLDGKGYKSFHQARLHHCLPSASWHLQAEAVRGSTVADEAWDPLLDAVPRQPPSPLAPAQARHLHPGHPCLRGCHQARFRHFLLAAAACPDDCL